MVPVRFIIEGPAAPYMEQLAQRFETSSDLGGFECVPRAYLAITGSRREPYDGGTFARLWSIPAIALWVSASQSSLCTVAACRELRCAYRRDQPKHSI